jgi:hypothetical protein
MMPVDYELGREYQQDRQREAASYRLLRQGTSAQRSGAGNLHFAPSTRHLRAWINDLLGFVPGGVESRRRTSTMGATTRRSV